ncbi:unnamed protein product [Somion occarium]|uniref:Myb-like domain-containing protein n=1 Tax=Somion occarium TaxID=3059160 RepID=A0ABP1E8S9_9APHY
MNQSSPSSTAQVCLALSVLSLAFSALIVLVPRADDAQYSPSAQANFSSSASASRIPVQPAYSSTLTSYESAAAAASTPSQAHPHQHPQTQHQPQQQPQLQQAYQHSGVPAPVYSNPPVFFQHQHPPPGPAPPQHQSSSSTGSPVQSSSSPTKRKYDDSQTDEFGTPKGGTKTVRKRRLRVNLAGNSGTDEIKDDVVVGSSPVIREGRGEGGGAKHWTDEEKGKLFAWMLGSDDNWAAFANQMNSVFREASQVLFNNTKSFTALKSCYHRNVETFKQISAFTQFLASSLSSTGAPETPVSTSSADPNNTAASQDILSAPIPPSFQSGIHRQTFLERKLEAGRSVAGIPVANLNIKVVDHWYRLGWYELFRRRYRYDPVQNAVVPYHGPDPLPPDPLSHIFPQPSLNLPLPTLTSGPSPQTQPQASGSADQLDPSLADRGGEYHQLNNSSIDGQGEDEEAMHDDDDDEQEGESQARDDGRAANTREQPHASTSSSQIQHTAPASQPQPQLVNGQLAHRPGPPPALSYAYPGYVHPADPNGHAQYYAAYKPSPYPPPLPQPSPSQMQATQQSLSHLASLTQTLITSCNTLTELLRAQVEDGKALRELLRRQEERELRREESAKAGGSLPGTEGLQGKEKAAFAKEMLSSPGCSEELKQVAADYLKRIFK